LCGITVLYLRDAVRAVLVTATCLAGWRCPSHAGIKTAKPIWLLWNVNRKSWVPDWMV